MDIFKRARQLGFPLGKYVVVGGAMEAYGIRPANDIDVVVMPDLFERLQSEGWEVCLCNRCQEMMAQGEVKKILHKKGMEVDVLSEYTWYDAYRIDTDYLIQTADIIDGIPFVRLEELLKWKKAAGRSKDLQDIKLIETYLNPRDKKI